MNGFGDDGDWIRWHLLIINRTTKVQVFPEVCQKKTDPRIKKMSLMAECLGLNMNGIFSTFGARFCLGWRIEFDGVLEIWSQKHWCML